MSDTRPRIYLHILEEDRPYLVRIKRIVGGRAAVFVPDTSAPIGTLTELMIAAKARGTTQIATTSVNMLQALLDFPKKKVHIRDYMGSIIDWRGYEFLILPPFEQLFTVPYMEHLVHRYLDKYIEPRKFVPQPEFTWDLFTPDHTEQVLDLAYSSTFIANDTETGHEDDRTIICNGFTFVNLNDNRVKLSTVVIPYKDAYHHAVATHVLQSPTPKVYQNGMYDASYFIRFDQPPRNYCMDTINMFHAWYSEMPKDLGFITAYLLRKTQYWKNEGGSGNLLQEYAYNAKDCYNTALCAIAWLLEAPEWAKRNYLMEFPLVFPNLMAGIRGLRRNNAVMESIRQEWLQKLDVQRKALVTMSGDPDYNPGSPQQNVRLIAALGSPDIKESNRIARDKVRARHPLNRRIMDAIDKYAEDKKLESAYIRDQKEKDGKPQVDSYGNPKLKTWHGRMLYNILPHGTDTGRQASQESPFWCGWQIQNIPREDEDVNIKDGIEAEPDFFFGEADKSQAEARYTAYASGDVALINAVEDETHDFHGFNASKFFGLEYTSIVNSFFDEEEQQWRHKTLNKPIRDLSKRTNHGANYNMAARVLLDTMGIDRVILAKSLLKLPRGWNLLQVCQYLLDNFDKTYPVVRGEYYDWIKKCIRTTHMLVGATGWTRYCFGKPWENKRDMNRYAAHVGQSLNAMVLNTGVMRVFYNIALRYTSQFKFCAQIHDSILFQYRKDQPWLAFAVAHEMHNPITITDAGGITRNMSVPVDVKGGSEKWGSLKELRVTMLDAEQKALLAKHIETSTYRPPSF